MNTNHNALGLRPARIVLNLFLAIGALAMAGPFIWMMFSSFKPLGEIFAQPPKLLPQEWHFDNYPRALAAADFGRGFFNSFYIAATVTLVSLLTSAMAAYAFARLRFFGRNSLFMAFLATMMVPMQLTVIPLYLVMGWLHWVDTHLALIVPAALFNAFGVFLLRQYIRGIPLELEEAAAIDGAGRVRIFLTIILPLLRTPMTALGIFVFLGQWNSFFHPLIFLNSDDKFTIPLLVNQFKGQYGSDWTSLMAAATLAAAPLLLIFVIAQRQIVEGIALSGSKT
ncbi:carbohydrate ABC transporter permease [Kribbella albertanoniae]|uniref:Carbohydrate ABC transporter permease n=1 Tax=Kribbella albertanoniae TaxID=1266829 RepID=A0A4R4PXT5_9ACTN|nr:carbohydrate ABC transporter permease [Kribbella albertanoniae]TDC27350.1 carbohydrate ABC transporter permease [Kribbella albertanoniae]